MGNFGVGHVLPESPSPSPGDVYVVLNDRAYYCHTAGEWVVFGSDVASERYYYDTLNLGQRRYPLTISDFEDPNKSAAPNIIYSFSTYSNCTWLITDYTDKQTYLEKFDTVGDLVDWINANIPTSGTPARFNLVDIKPFDETDASIPVIERMYGINNLYMGLRHGKNRSTYNHLGFNVSYGSGLLYAIWQEFFPTISPFISSADFGSGANGRKACWTGKNSTQMYSMPRLGEIVYIQDTTAGVEKRHSGNENWEGFNPIQTGDVYLTFDAVRIVLTDWDLTGWEFVPPVIMGSDLQAVKKHMLNEGEDTTGLVVYRLYSSYTPGDRQVAIFIKPLGIDKVWLPYYDSANYDLEIVHTSNQDMQSVFRRIEDTEINRESGSSPHPNSGLFVTKRSWLRTGAGGSRFGQANLRHLKGSNNIRAYFRLRDKSTGRIGRFSPSHIELRLNETNAPLKFMVRQDRF